jgi:hypothetical protein
MVLWCEDPIIFEDGLEFERRFLPLFEEGWYIKIFLEFFFQTFLS